MASAFAPPALGTSFTGHRVALSTRPVSIAAVPLRQAPCMQDGKKKGFFFNPFAKKPDKAEQQPAATFMEPQAGDPGFGKSARKAADTTVSGFKEQLQEVGDMNIGEQIESNPLKDIIMQRGSLKRGLELLREDILKNAPERVGVGRQDTESITMKPVAGEPGYKPQSYQTAKVSELRTSPSAGAAKAAEEAEEKKNKTKEVMMGGAKDKMRGKGGKSLQKEAESVNVGEGEKQYDLPDYLKPIPEDTPRKGSTWRNYSGR